MKINVHKHGATAQVEGIEIVNQYPTTLDTSLPAYSVGIHPWYIKEDNIEEELRLLELQLQGVNCLAIGECGLDKKANISLNIQVEVFKRQLLLAEKYKKAVILHVVSAFQEVIAIKKQLNISVPLIIHGFNKKHEVAESLWKNGFYLSFGRHLIDKESLQSTFLQVPKERLFLETDDAAEVTIAEVYQVAERLCKDIETIIEQNYRTVFNR
ncbi:MULTISPECIES: TatD family hydrolase [Myroides]|uniref:TatD family deoxyribonuclease n=1 Tax=Myroides albus TaxID=2562892 RepID=A0A6I3LNN9_9FLAO|nr:MULTISPECIES: TatD family hydrolase [Myroides]MTG99056.1 TatD family deoxyribonuclease [Myroides albus]MVX36654.1 TatD family deoxyribonuclease [Myroides sp. LoEW2-1]UVD80413.1 TatD family hydrolase [Myroides albus]